MKTKTGDYEVEPTEIQLARLDERMKMLLDRMEETHESHVKTRAWMSQVDRTLGEISHRVTNVETSMNKNAPTLEEFMVIKNRVIGAGVAGRWLWVGLGALLGILFGFREYIFRIFSGNGS